MKWRGSGLAWFVVLFFAQGALGQGSEGAKPWATGGAASGSMSSPFDRRTLPAGLRNARLEHLSSGALLRLNRENSLVVPPAASAARPGARPRNSAATIDERVLSNTQLGEDPAGLPAQLRAQAEPHIARSPLNPDLLIATFQEGRFTNGGAVDCGYAVSTDGGRTWTRNLIPGLTQTSGGPYLRATDPVAAIDLNDTIYLNTEGATAADFTRGVVLVSRSTDRGATFDPPVVVFDPGGSGAFPDKPWMAVNTFPGTANTGRLVVTFTLFTGASINGAPIFCSFSDDAGLTWSTARQATALGIEAQGSQPVFLPDGRLALVYWNFGTTASPGERLEVIVSSDGGANFGPVRQIAAATEYNEPSIRTGSFLPSAATDRTSGQLSVVYQTRISGAPRIVFTRSSDAGATWTAPVPISDNPADSGVFNAAVAVSPDGQTLSAIFYDHRANPGSTTLCDLFLAQSFNGGASWQENVRISSVSTDATLAPLTAQGYMLGDYLGVAPSSNTGTPAVPVWIDSRSGSPDPFVARVLAHPRFFSGEVPLSNGIYYLNFPGGSPFGYFTYQFYPYLYHFDLGFEYFIPANDTAAGAFFFDFASSSWFYSSPSFPFPYLYDLSLNAPLYYFADANRPDRYTSNPRFFYNFATRSIITK